MNKQEMIEQIVEGIPYTNDGMGRLRRLAIGDNLVWSDAALIRLRRHYCEPQLTAADIRKEMQEDG